MADDGTVWIWTTAILAVSVGFAAGFLVAYLAVLRDKDATGLREELAREKEEFERYRGRVDDHFVKTSELFQDMTRQYGALYQHLADGAQSLCSDRLVTHQPSVPDSTPMVEHKGGVAPAAAAASSAATRAQAAPQTEAATEAEPSQAEPHPETEVPASTSPREPVRSTASNELDESEMESLAPRPEAAHLRTPAPTAVQQEAETANQEEEAKPRLH